MEVSHCPPGAVNVAGSRAGYFADFEHTVRSESDHGTDGRHDNDHSQHIDRIVADRIAAQAVQVDTAIADPGLYRIRAYDGCGDGIAWLGRRTYLLAAMACLLKFGYVKIMVDVSPVVIAAALSLIFLHGLQGVREGTVAAAVFVGMLAKQLNRFMIPFGQKIFRSSEKKKETAGTVKS